MYMRATEILHFIGDGEYYIVPIRYRNNTAMNHDAVEDYVAAATVPAPIDGGGAPMLLTDPEVFACCKCCKTLTIPVYECIQGHPMLCSPCYGKHGNKCPYCSAFVENNRCHAIEAVMESMRTACVNARHGCNELLKYGEKREHEKTCTFVQCLCPQPRCDWISNANELGQHFKVKHLHKRLPFRYDEFFGVSLRHNTRTCVLQSLSDGKMFVISNDMRGKESSLILFHVRPNSSTPQFGYEVRENSDGVVLLPRTSVECTQGLKFEFSSASFVSIPIEMWSRDEKIKLQFQISTLSADNANGERDESNGRPKRVTRRPTGWENFFYV